MKTHDNKVGHVEEFWSFCVFLGNGLHLRRTWLERVLGDQGVGSERVTLTLQEGLAGSSCLGLSRVYDVVAVGWW